MAKRNRKKMFVVCVWNRDYPASLELMKIYERLADAEAETHDLIRVIDEDGEDYLYPSRYFLPIDLTRGLEQAFEAVTELQPA